MSELLSVTYQGTLVLDHLFSDHIFGNKVSIDKIELAPGTGNEPAAEALILVMARDSAEVSGNITCAIGSASQTTAFTGVTFNADEHFGLKVKQTGGCEGLEIYVTYSGVITTTASVPVGSRRLSGLLDELESMLLINVPKGVFPAGFRGKLTYRLNSIQDYLTTAIPDCAKGTERFTCAAPYKTGSVSITKGAKALTFVGTTLTSAMESRTIIIGAVRPAYVFGFDTTTVGTIDENFVEDTVSGGSYQIVEKDFTLVSEMKTLLGVKDMSNNKDLDLMAFEDFQRLYPAPILVKTPTTAIMLPNGHLELYPAPEEEILYEYTYRANLGRLDSEDDYCILQPELYPVLLAGAYNLALRFDLRVEAGVRNEASYDYEKLLQKAIGTFRKVSTDPIVEFNDL